MQHLCHYVNKTKSKAQPKLSW